jgi:hypothetical protein
VARVDYGNIDSLEQACLKPEETYSLFSLDFTKDCFILRITGPVSDNQSSTMRVRLPARFIQI